jgi:hypothetical protein
MLLEWRKDDQRFTCAINAKASAIKNKFIIGTHLIDKKKWCPVFGRMTSDDIVSKSLFASVKRGSSYINNQGGTLFGHRLNRIMRISASVPQSGIIPGILANGYAQGPILESHYRIRGSWIKVSRFVKNIISGQQGFMLGEKESALIQ